MENKDCLLAIIRNLHDAGLAVTWLRKNRNTRNSKHTSTLKDSNADYNCLTLESVQSAAAVADKNNSPTSIATNEIMNDKYEANFQVNHCNVEPPSPSHSVETPMQRPEVSLSPIRVRTSLNTELFANSLRKYPIVDDTRSAELIQKLLDRTQAKHTRRHIEKRKSDGKRREVSKNPSKLVQTVSNLMSQTEVSDAHVKKLEIRLNINRNLMSRHSMSPVLNDSSRLRSDDPIEMYDYLNASRSPTKRDRSSERDVLYLTNFIKDTIKQIVDDGSHECTNISSRLRNHQLSHHPELNHCETTCPRTTNARSQVTLTTSSRNEEALSSVSPWAIGSYCTKPVNKCSCRELHLRDALNISKIGEPEPECLCRSQELKQKPSWEHCPRFVKKTKPCFCSKSKYERNVDLQLTAWLHELPIFATECPKARKKREDIVKSLADKLKNNKINDDNIDAVKNEIQRAVKALPIWCPEGEDESEVFRNKLSDNLLSKLKEISKPTAEFEQLVINWLDKLPLESVDFDGQPINKAGLRENIINELKEIIINRPKSNYQYKEMLRDKLKQINQELPLHTELNLDNLEQLNNKLADELITISPEIFSDKRLGIGLKETFQKLVSDWIFNIPGISTDDLNDISEINNMVDNLCERLDTIPLQKGNEEDIKKEIRKEVKDLLNQLNVMKGNQMGSKNEDEYVNDIVNQLWDVTKSLDQSKENFDENYSPQLMGLLQDNPELLHPNNKEKVKQLKLKLKELQKDGVDEETCRKIMQKEIPKVLRGTDYKKIESDKRDIQKIKQNRNELSESSNDSQTQTIEPLILEWLNNIPEFAASVPDKDITDLSRTLQTILSKSGDDENVKIKLKDVTKNWLQKVSKKAVINLDPKIIDKLATDLIYKKLPKQRKRWSPQTLEPKHKAITGVNFENVSKNDSEVSDSDERKIISSSQKVRPAQKTVARREHPYKGSDDRQKMSTEQEKNKYSPLGQRPGQKRNINKGESSNTVKEGTSVLTDNIFQGGASKIVSNFFDEIMGKKFPEKKKEVVRELLPKLEEIMYDPLINPIQKEDLMNEEIKNCLKKLQIGESLQNNYAKTLMDRLKNVFKTSTPRGSIMSFHLERDDNELLPIFVDSSDYNILPASPEEVMYMNTLNDSIELWIDKLHIDFDSEDDRKFKKAFIKDLTSDIIDRQKYLQLNPSTLSETEELEHLKYQIFRWFNKKFNDNVVENVMSQVKSLRDMLKNISVPILIKPKNRHRMTSPMPTDFHLQDEISTFISGFPSDAFASNDQSYNEQIINELFNKLQLNNCDIDTEITDCLRKLFKPTLEYDINNLTQQLKSILINKGFLKDDQLTQSILMEDTSEFIEENICGVIMDWLKDLSTYQRRNSSEKHEMEALVINLAKSLKNILRQSESYSEDILDEILIKEVMNHLNKFPLDQSQESDDNIRVVAKNLIDKLKATQMFQDISKRKMSGGSLQKQSESMGTGLNTFHKNIEKWCDEIPFKLGTSFTEIEKTKPIKRDITNKLLHKIGELNMNPDIFSDDMLYEDLLREEVDTLLLNLPIDESNLPALKEKLVTVVKEGKKKIQDELAARDYKERLRDTVSKYLPTPCFSSIDKEASFEIIKENLADAFVNLHFTVDDEKLKNKYRRKIHDELGRFCDSYLKRCPATPLDTTKLSQGLYNALMKIPVPSDEAIKNQIEQTRIKNEINDWLERLPLRTLTGAEELQRSKLITLLAKYLHEAEMAKETYSESDYTAVMKKEIVKFLKKYIRPDTDNVEQFATRLIDNLKNTENTRKFNAPTRVDGSEVSCAYQKYLSQKVICGGGCDPSTVVIQGSSMSDEDREYLRRIKDRAACNKPLPCTRSPSCRDAMLSFSPKNAGSQTEVCPSYKKCPSFTKVNSGRQPKKQLSSSTQVPPCRSSVRPQEIIPKVNINEYAWESTDISNSICPDETTECCPQQSTIPCPLYNNSPDYPNRQPQLKSPKRLSFSYPNATFEIPRQDENSDFLQPNYVATETQKATDNGNRSQSHPTTPCTRPRSQVRDSSKEILMSMDNDDYEPCSAYIPNEYNQTFDKDLGGCKCKSYIWTKCDGTKPKNSCFQSCTSQRNSFRHSNIHTNPKCRRGLCSHQSNLFSR